jgi:beta-lactamase class A
MMRFQSLDGLSATLPRRHLLIFGLAAALAGCGRGATMSVSTTPPLDVKLLDTHVPELAAKVRPGRLGVGLVNLESGETWFLNGAQAFPMQSVFKVVLGAAALAEVDAGRLSLDEVISLTDQMLSPPHSPIAAAWPARKDYTVRELLIAAVGDSDNTAADVLMKRIGGPGAVTGWLQAKNLPEIRIDRYEREIQVESLGLASFRAAWRGETAFTAVIARVPPAQRLAAMRSYLADPRDTATPRGMLDFLRMLQAGELIAGPSSRLLLQIMTATPSGANRLKAALPAGAVLAHKAGTGRRDQGVDPAVNDVGLITLRDRRVYAAAVFLAGAREAGPDAENIIADVGRLLVRAAG